jgi:aldose 1-epimerase
MTPTLLSLEDGLTHLSLAPQLGGSIANWSVTASGQPLLRHSDAPALAAATPRRLACYPLAPWSNRIAGGGFDCPDAWLSLHANSPNEPLPIHGSAWQQPWQVIEHSQAQVCLQLDSAEPFAYRALQRFHLADGRLCIDLRVTHLAEHAAWHGLGLHPYFPRTGRTRLQAAARQVWHCDEARLSTGLGALPTAWDFRQAKRLPADQLDNAFSDWDGRCRIIQEDAGYQLDCRASGAGLYLLYCPAGQDFFCFEPVSHPVNAHHLPGRPGLRLLCQGESIDMSFSLHYRAL